MVIGKVISVTGWGNTEENVSIFKNILLTPTLVLLLSNLPMYLHCDREVT